MSGTPIAFSGSIPENYDEHLGTLFFEPYAKDLAARIEALQPASILEVACGTGRLTQYLPTSAPGVKITATDINQAMLDVAAKKVMGPAVTFSIADGTALPFKDSSYDLIVEQFGVMFYPDKPKAFREAYRVLPPGGVFLFNTWDKMVNIPLIRLTQDVMEEFFPSDTPMYLTIPFSYYNEDEIIRDVKAGGFTDVSIETVKSNGYGPSSRSAAVGLIKGLPTYTAIMEREPGKLDQMIDRLEELLTSRFGEKDIAPELIAFVVTCRK
jgi:ubiquinone/menaquinone biosynthesis C-methylase UbiE